MPCFTVLSRHCHTYLAFVTKRVSQQMNCVKDHPRAKVLVRQHFDKLNQPLAVCSDCDQAESFASVARTARLFPSSSPVRRHFSLAARLNTAVVVYALGAAVAK